MAAMSIQHFSIREHYLDQVHSMRSVFGRMEKECDDITHLERVRRPAFILHKANMPRLGDPILDFSISALYIERHGGVRVCQLVVAYSSLQRKNLGQVVGCVAV